MTIFPTMIFERQSDGLSEPETEKIAIKPYKDLSAGSANQSVCVVPSSEPGDLLRFRSVAFPTLAR